MPHLFTAFPPFIMPIYPPPLPPTYIHTEYTNSYNTLIYYLLVCMAYLVHHTPLVWMDTSLFAFGGLDKNGYLVVLLSGASQI